MRRPGWWVSVPATVLLPLAVATVTVVGTVRGAALELDARPLDAVGIALLVAGSVMLVVRRRNPPAVLLAAALCGAVYFIAGYPGGPAFLAALVALWEAIVTGYRRGAYAVTTLTFALMLTLYVIRFPAAPLPLFGATGLLSTLVTVVVAAEWWRARTERREQMLAARAESERRRVSEERLRIARELHDAIGHHVSLINVQAGVAHYLLDDDLEQARTALAAITATSSELLREMRATLGVLRGVDEEPTREPVTGLSRLEDLAGATRAGGLAVTVEVRGEVRDLPSTVDLAAYRIVQEALTNTLRHARAHLVTILLVYQRDAVTVEIADDGRGPAGGTPREGGDGLPGMRERAAALGGRLAVGPGEDGGFRVRAHLPTAVAETSQ